MLFIAIEIAMVILFMIVLADAARCWNKDRHKLVLLLLAFVYALIFENLNMFIGHGQIGSYFYNPGFKIFIWHTPLFIALAWACLIYTAMHLTDMLKLKTLTKPFMDALIIVSIDLTMDVVAVRQGLWTWVGFSSFDGWFGVPANNFIGWLFVAFTFSFLFRYFTRTEDDMINKTTRTEYFFLLPAFAYLSMLVLFSIVNLAESALALSRGEELFVLWALVIFFALMLRHQKKHVVNDLGMDNYTVFVVLFTRLLFYAYIVWSFVFTEVYEESVALILILLMTIIAEVLVYHSAFGHIGKNIEIMPRQKEYKRY